MSKNNTIKTKAQHEIMGFVLIVLLVSIIIIIFLSLSINPNRTLQEDNIEVSNLLQASMYVTTDCEISWPMYYEDMQALILEVTKNKDNECLNGETVEKSLEKYLRSLIEDTLKIGDNLPNKAYTLKIYERLTKDPKDDNVLIQFEKGSFSDCKSKTGGRHIIDNNRGLGKVVIELMVCKG
ncbi:MAG: hypothetical protein Q8N99_06035 [Nanoarchaeota archaeon]|nr:hypothetical protein [Nanoarchaeota archaeon]